MNSDALIELVATHLSLELYCHVLVDPIAVPDNSEDSLITHLAPLGESALIRVYRDDLPHAPQLHPLLATLASPGTSPSHSLLALSARAAQRDIHRHNRHVCGWILSKEPAPVIAKHLAALCRLPTNTSNTVFQPIYQPIRLELLAATFERVESGPWWPIKHWIFQTSGAKLAAVKGEPGARTALPAPALRLQSDVALIQRFLSLWQALRIAPSLPPFAAVRASNLIDDARKVGLSAPQDVLVLAVHYLCIHPRLHTLPAIRRHIEDAINQHITLAASFARYSEADWRHMVTKLPRPEEHA
ncbi:hypothetical protein [Pseudomonas sp. PSKL.D1]|uniref:hypothetical protein n=1 Tax=Pseudomonas sp. PSKL.D1 TaxID=3029060 RepID=UPI00238144A9|nr:hypothetical protein [Pseudomonas sp. PSKL.D1]WDY56303.1 hypothetical protein PVV54_17045 [Pseudomonas sp. PSKL.D1]